MANSTNREPSSPEDGRADTERPDTPVAPDRPAGRRRRRPSTDPARTTDAPRPTDTRPATVTPTAGGQVARSVALQGTAGVMNSLAIGRMQSSILSMDILARRNQWFDFYSKLQAPTFNVIQAMDTTRSIAAKLDAVVSPVQTYQDRIASIGAIALPKPIELPKLSNLPRPIELPKLGSGVEELLRTQQRWTDTYTGLAKLPEQFLRVGSVADALRNVTAPWMAMASSVASFVDQTGRWTDLASTLARAARHFDTVLFAALADSREAVLRGDDDAVLAFFRRWATLPRHGWRERVEAAKLALLEIDLTGHDPEDALALLEQVQKKANQDYRSGWVPLGETSLHRRKMLYVEELPHRADAPDIAAEDFLPGSRSTEDRVLARLNDFDDERLAVLIGGLTADDARVLQAYGLSNGDSWPAAAQACGLPERNGERVRALVHRRAEALGDIPMGPTSPFRR